MGIHAKTPNSTKRLEKKTACTMPDSVMTVFLLA
jgi:hypothetical protein